MVGAEKAFNCPIISGLLSASAMYVEIHILLQFFRQSVYQLYKHYNFCCQKTACRRLSVIFLLILLMLLHIPLNSPPCLLSKITDLLAK